MASTTTKERSPVLTTPIRRRSIHIKPFRIVVYAILTLGAVLFVTPFLWMVSTSLQTRGDIIRGRFIPSQEFLHVYAVEDQDLDRTLQDHLDSGQFPPYLDVLKSQIEGNGRQRAMTVREYLRTQKFGYAEFSLGFIGIDKKYVVVGGAAQYIEAWDESNFSKYFFNSIKIAVLTIMAQTVSSILAAYAFARIEFPGRNLLFSVFIATIFIPTMVVLIPNRQMVTNIDRFFTEDFPEKQDD